MLKNPAFERGWPADLGVRAEAMEVPCGSGGHDRRLDWEQLGQFPQVLGGGGEEELVAGAAEADIPSAVALSSHAMD